MNLELRRLETQRFQGNFRVVNTKEELSKNLYLATSVNDVWRLVAQGANVNGRDSNGSTPLHYALNAEVTRALLAVGADVKINDFCNAGPLHHIKDPDAIPILVSQGLNVNELDFLNMSPLDMARSRSNNEAVIAALIAAGAKPGPDCLSTSSDQVPLSAMKV